MEEEDDVINLQESLTAALRDGEAAAAEQMVPEMHPAELAAVYESLAEDERAGLLKLLPADILPAFLQHLPPADAVTILGDMKDADLAPLLEEIPDDVLVDS